MKFVTLCAAAMLASTLYASGPVAAQALDPWCEQQARLTCGDRDGVLSMTDCSSEPDFWSGIPNECVGDLQTMVEMEREAGVGGGSASSPVGTMLGFSYGGVLREGPGMDFRRIASLRDGDEIEILEDTGIWFDGYKWFRVATARGTGFHWGGIFCHEGGASVDGILSSCN